MFQSVNLFCTLKKKVCSLNVVEEQHVEYVVLNKQELARNISTTAHRKNDCC